MSFNLPLTSKIALLLVILACPLIYSRANLLIRLIALVQMFAGGTLLLIRLRTPQVLLSILLCGVSCALLLGIAGNKSSPARIGISGFMGKVGDSFLLGAMILLLSFGAERQLFRWIPVPDSILLASIYILGESLVCLMMDHEVYDGFLALVGILFSFQMIYLLLEPSALVLACLIAISLLTAFSASFLKLPVREDEE